MTWLYNLKITAKLLISFLLLAVIAGVIGYEGVSQINKLNAADTGLYENITMPITVLTDLSKAFINIRVNVRDLMLSRSKSESDGYQANLKQLEQDINKYLAQYEKDLAGQEEKDTFSKFSGGVKDYFVGVERFEKLLNSGDKEGAMVYLRGDFLALAKVTNTALDKLREIKVAQAKNTSDSNTVLANTASTSMISFIGVGVILALGLGLWISSIVGKPLRNIPRYAINWLSAIWTRLWNPSQRKMRLAGWQHP